MKMMDVQILVYGPISQCVMNVWKNLCLVAPDMGPEVRGAKC